MCAICVICECRWNCHYSRTKGPWTLFRGSFCTGACLLVNVFARGSFSTLLFPVHNLHSLLLIHILSSLHTSNINCCLNNFLWISLVQNSDSDDDMNNPKPDDLPEGWEQRTDPDTGRCVDHIGILLWILLHSCLFAFVLLSSDQNVFICIRNTNTLIILSCIMLWHEIVPFRLKCASAWARLDCAGKFTLITSTSRRSGILLSAQHWRWGNRWGSFHV